MNPKEFFLGTRQEQQAKATINTLSGRQRLSNSQKIQQAEAKRISRRLFLRRAATATAGGLVLITGGVALAGVGHQSETEDSANGNSSFKLPEFAGEARTIQITNAPENWIDIDSPTGFEVPTLEALYADLQKDSGTTEDRLRAIQDNISIILGNEGNNGTTLRIDDNGTFLTVAHILTKNDGGKVPVTTPTVSVHLHTGVTSPIRKMYLDLNDDIALHFAHSGMDRKPTTNIQFETKPLASGDKVWLMGIVQNPNSKRFDLRIATGVVFDKPKDFPEALNGLILAKGLNGIGGTSGGPVVDRSGKLIGVYKGLISDGTQDYDLIVPISSFQKLLNNPSSYSLPTH